MLRLVWPYLRRYRRGLALGLGSLVVKVLTATCIPLLIGRGVDTLMQGFRLEVLMRLCALLIALSAVKGLFQYWMRVILIGISRDIEYDLRNDLFAHLVNLSPDFYASTRTGDIMARATNDLNAVRMMLGPGIMYWAETSFTFVLAVGVMLRVDWRLTLICAGARAAGEPGGGGLFGRIIHERFEKIQAMFSDISSRVQENLAGVRVIRAYVQEEAELRHFERLNRQYIGAEHAAGPHLQRVHAAAAGPDRRSPFCWCCGRRLQAARGHHLAGQLRDVQHLHGHADLADDRASAGW